MTTLLIGLYVACELISNVTAGKPVAIGGIVVPAAVFLYTLTFTLIDLINERLGKTGARQVVATAFAANLLLAGYVQFAIWLPAAPFYRDAGAFAGVLGSTPRIVFASLVAYLVSSLVDRARRGAEVDPRPHQQYRLDAGGQHPVHQHRFRRGPARVDPDPGAVS